MNNEEFLRGKLKYDELLQKKQKAEDERDSRLFEIDIRIKCLEENENVKEYIDLNCEKNQIKNDAILKSLTSESNSKIIYEAFDNICKNTQDSNNIYAFMWSNGLTSIYKDLETTKEEIVPFNKQLLFSKKHRVIYPTCNNTELFFDIVRKEYLRYLSKFSQDEAVNKVLKLGEKSVSGR